MIIGECKDEGDRVDSKDVENLRQVADAIPAHRFDPYILLARLSPFSEEEIALAKTLNDEYRWRTILLSARELEPYYLYERVKRELKIEVHGGSPEASAKATAQVYFTALSDETVKGSAPTQHFAERVPYRGEIGCLFVTR